MAKFIPYGHDSHHAEGTTGTGTLENAIHELVEKKIDLSVFENSFKNDASGAPAFDPKLTNLTTPVG